jgi:uncharacterized membrane protein YphA (DoxX/SURF4 family)
MSGIYVEIQIQSAIDELWDRTQSPELHRQWDLRFTDIEYLPRPESSHPQRFLYSTRIGFGLNINGEGETLGTREVDGSRTSALKFWSRDPKSLIGEGSGYWKYIPDAGGVRFLTWYDYSTRFGLFGRLFDAFLFRPLMGWATAWSFDRLRLWLEKQIHPVTALRQSLIYAVSRGTVAFIWIYQGLVPKLLASDVQETFLMRAAGVPSEYLFTASKALGLAEVSLGLALLVGWRVRSLFGLTAGLMIAALIAVALQAPGSLSAAFNPVTLNSAMVSLSVIGLYCMEDLPSARRCKRIKPEEQP